MKMEHGQSAGRVRRGVVFAAVCALIWAAAVVPMAAQDFDFYANDLISQESYKKISMDFKDASLKDILKIFSEQSGLNFIASQAIQDRTVTLYLDQVPLQDALDKIMTANNLTYKMDPGSNIFMVQETGLPALGLMTKVYVLKYAHLAGSKIQAQIDEMKATQTGSDDSGGASASPTAQGVSSIEKVVENVLSSNGKMIVDHRTNSVIVTDVPPQFDVIDRVVALLDTQAPQVMIEVEMLDVSKRTIDEMGVETTSSLIQLTGGKVDTRFPNFMSDSIGRLMSAVQKGEVAEPDPEDLAAMALKTFQFGVLDASVFTALLEYLTTDSRTKFLARPRILTMSQQKAIIQISTEEAIGQNTVINTDTNTETTGAERFSTGVTLVVTPQVDLESGMVTMAVEPTVSEAKTGGTFNNTTYKDPEVRSSKSTLVVKDGETIVVGGLIRNRVEETKKKMPILGDIPLLGMLFRHTDKSEEERELIVFITPRIVGFKNAAVLARSEGRRPLRSSSSPGREQPLAVSRKRQVDNMLQRWEN